MDSHPKQPNPVRLLADLQSSGALKHQPVVATGLDPRLALLREWQADRLSHTYADLLGDKRFRPACLFFLSDIYAARDLSQRDHDVERLYALASRVVPAPMLRLLVDVMELNSLTNTLDMALIHALEHEFGGFSSITSEQYAAAYRHCDNYADRLLQIELVSRIIVEVAEGARLPVVNLALKVVHGPAHRAGWDELYSFVERGFRAFKRMRDVKLFAATIEQREKLILDRIFASHPDPFAV